MSRVPSLDELWDSARLDSRSFQPGDTVGLPAAARRFLEHAVEPGARLASAVRLRMKGEIKLKSWVPFDAEQVICRDRGMVWRAVARMRGMSIRGFDCLIDGRGEMRWKVLGIIPVMTAAGPDVSRSAAGRVAAESIWLPSAFCSKDVAWEAEDASHVHACFSVWGENADLRFTVDESGRLESLSMRRWGNPGDGGFRYENFGGLVEEEATFQGYTIPTRLRAGWYIGSDRFGSEGEFFRCRIESADFR